MLQALLEEMQVAGATFAVREGMDALKSHRELDDVPEQLALDSVAIGEQPPHLCGTSSGSTVSLPPTLLG